MTESKTEVIAANEIIMMERNGSSLYVQEIQREALRNARMRNERRFGMDISELEADGRTLAKLKKPAHTGPSRIRWYKYAKSEQQM